MKLDTFATLPVLALALGCGDKGGDSASSGYTPRPGTYMFLASDAEWVAPSVVGKLVPVPDHPVLIGVQANGPTAVHLTIAWGDGSYSNPRQNVGRKTLDIGVPIDRDGHFAYGPKDTDREADDGELIIEDFALSGTLTDAAIHDLVVTGSIDAAGVYDAVDLSGVEAFCSTMGATCVPCSDGGQRCLPFEAHQTEAARLPDDFPFYEFTTGSWCAGVLFLPIGAAVVRRRKAAV
jgi:hypothetical protein